MEKIYSKIEKDKLLHMVHRADEFHTIEDNGVRRDVVGEDEFIQLSALNMDKGHTFKPHKHIWKPGEKKVKIDIDKLSDKLKEHIENKVNEQHKKKEEEIKIKD